LIRPRLLAVAVATVQFSRIAGGVHQPHSAPGRGMRGGHPACAGLSKLNSMPGARAELLKKRRSANGVPVRFGRRARPDGSSNGPEWAGGSAGAPFGAP